MSFDTILEDIIAKVEGSVAVVIMGFDGITISSKVKESTGLDIEALSIEYTKIIGEVVKTANFINAGNVWEIAISTQNYFILFHLLPGNYFVSLLLSENGNLGKGRYMLRKSAPELIAQF